MLCLEWKEGTKSHELRSAYAPKSMPNKKRSKTPVCPTRFATKIQDSINNIRSAPYKKCTYLNISRLRFCMRPNPCHDSNSMQLAVLLCCKTNARVGMCEETSSNDALPAGESRGRVPVSQQLGQSASPLVHAGGGQLFHACSSGSPPTPHCRLDRELTRMLKDKSPRWRSALAQSSLWLGLPPRRWWRCIGVTHSDWIFVSTSQQ